MKCPICKTQCQGIENNKDFPFCSLKCKNIDLYNWMCELYTYRDTDEEYIEEDSELLWRN